MRPALCPASPSRQATESVAVSEQGLAVLPPGIEVIERGWLSANNVLLFDGNEATLVDSGYVSHAAQTVALVGGALAGRRLARLINTHSHSDHIGGNAAVQRAFGCRIGVPAGMAVGGMKTTTCPGSVSAPSRLQRPAAWAMASRPARAR